MTRYVSALPGSLEVEQFRLSAFRKMTVTGSVVPQIESARDAAEAVHHCQAAHAGRRYRDMLGFGSGSLSEDADDPVVCVVMVESALGISRIKEICAIDGIDGVYVGPRDLAISYGLAPKLELQSGPHADAARIVLDACHANNLVAGIHGESGAAARQRARDGFQMITVSSDQQFIRTEAETALGQIRAAKLRHDSLGAADDRRSGT
jgi:4-hydroxy-2-oxoheptanedioate aldolase